MIDENLGVEEEEEFFIADSSPHCSKSSFFVQKFNFDFPEKIVDLGLFSC